MIRHIIGALLLAALFAPVFAHHVKREGWGVAICTWLITAVFGIIFAFAMGLLLS